MLQFVHVKADGTPTLNYNWLDVGARAMLLLELDIWAADIEPDYTATIQEAVEWSVNAHFDDWYTDGGDLVVVSDDTRTWIAEQLTRRVKERYA